MANLDRYSQNLMLSSKLFEMEKNYWDNQLRDNSGINVFPYNYISGLKVNQYSPGVINYRFPLEISKKIIAVGNKSEYSIFIILLSSVLFILSKYIQSKNILVGIPPIIKKKNSDSAFNSVVLPIRQSINMNLTYRSLLSEVGKLVIESDEYKNIPYPIIREFLGIQTDLNGISIFNTVVSLKNIHELNQSNDIRTDTHFAFVLNHTKIHLQLKYNQNLYRRQTLEQIIQHCNNFLKIVFINPDVQLGEIDLITKIEKKKLLFDFNDTEAKYPKDKTIQDLFAEQVRKTPNRIAVVFEDQQMTYRELDQKANCLAMVLRKKGHRPDDIVTIMVKRSFEMIIGILGILKSGGAYLPIDPEYPEERIKYIFADSETKILLTQAELIPKAGFNGEVLELNNPQLYQGDNYNLDKINTARDLAYIIYTSGSTGKPKGVMIEHYSFCNLITGISRHIHFTADIIILAVTTVSFDIFGLETLIPLTKGAKVVIANEKQQYNPKLLIDLIRKHKINMLQMTPSRILMLVSDPGFSKLDSLKVIMIGGEAFPESLIGMINGNSAIKIYNMYGPTETTVWSTLKELTDTDAITIGKPITNTKIYIVDPDNKPVPMGMIGELCIAGAGLARGYLNNPELTADKFIPNPFNLISESNPRMYKTGDLVRWLPDGNIEFIGRIDDQLKIGGFRIELGEIEKRLLEHESIKETIVLAKNNSDGDNFLCAYFVAERDISIHEVRESLLTHLPKYMVPAHFVPIKAMPLTTSGKIDRKKLLNMEFAIQNEMEYVAPSDEIETKLANILQEILNINKIGINDNFFKIGGNSFLAVKLYIMAEHNNLPVTYEDIFENKTIKGLAVRIKERLANDNNY